MNKLNELRFVVLTLGTSLGIVIFFLLLSSKTAHPDLRLGPSELLLTLLLILAFFGGNIGLSFHFCEVNKGKFSAARLDFKLIIIFFLVLYFFVVVALFLSSFWLVFPKAYYSCSALSLAGELLLGSLIDFGGRKIIGLVKK